MTKLETKEDFIKVGKKYLKGETLNDYAEFMVKAFPKESYWTVESYTVEWAERFQREKEWDSSDKQRQLVLLMVNKKKYQPMESIY